MDTMPPLLSVSACSQAIVFDGEGPAYDAIMGGQVKPGQVLVIRYEDPREGEQVSVFH